MFDFILIDFNGHLVNIRLIPKRRFANKHFEQTEKEVRPKRSFGTLEIEHLYLHSISISLKRHILFFSSIRKQHISL